MQLTTKLKEQLAEAVRISMRIEGYTSKPSQEIKARAKLLMEQQRVQVSVSRK